MQKGRNTTQFTASIINIGTNDFISSGILLEAMQGCLKFILLTSQLHTPVPQGTAATFIRHMNKYLHFAYLRNK
jgi:hypothetical protein